MKLKKAYLFIIGVAAVFATVGYFLLWNNNSGEVKYRTEKVTRGDVVVQVRATGTITPVRTVQVGSQVSGSIAKLFVDYNSVVKAGQVIAIIDSTFLFASVREADANLQRAQAQVNESQRNLARTVELFKKNLVSQADMDAAQTSYEQATAGLKQSQAALDRARVNLRYSIIRAPIDGVVISRDVDVGQTVAASLQAPKLFEIANDLNHMQVKANVDEADIGQIREGQSVTFTVDAYPNEQFRGTVRQVRLAPIVVQNVVTYDVIIEVDNTDMKLRPGMTATVSVLIDKREDALRVPALALRFRPPADVLEKILDQQNPNGGEMRESRRMQRGRRAEAGDVGQQRDVQEPYTGQVWLLEQGKNLKSPRVQLGLNDNRYVEVTGGELKEGDEVVVGLAVETASGAAQQSNPFAPRPPGGGGGRRGF